MQTWLANKQKDPSLGIFQIKTTTWHHCTPTRFVEIKVSDKVRLKDSKTLSETGGNLNWHKRL